MIISNNTTTIHRPVHDVKPSCPVSQTEFDRYTDKLDHLKTCHSDQFEMLGLESETTCDVCLKSFASSVLLRKHKKNVHLKRNQCTKCPKRFAKEKKNLNHPITPWFLLFRGFSL